MPGVRTEEQDYKEWLRKNGAEAKKRYKEHLLEKFKQDPESVKNQRYRFSAAWVKQWAATDAKRVREVIDTNPALQRLYRLLKTPYQVRLRRMRAKIRRDTLNPLIAEKNKIQKAIEPVFEKLQELNRQMRDVLEKIDFTEFEISRCIVRPTDKELKKLIKAKVKQLTFGAARELYILKQLKLRELHGFHSYLNKKYKQPHYVDRFGRKLMRRRKGFIPLAVIREMKASEADFDAVKQSGQDAGEQGAQNNEPNKE